MISLSYHYHNNRRREREAAERRSNKDRKNTDIRDEFGSNKNLSMSPRQTPKTTKQKSIDNAQQTSSRTTPNGQTSNRLATNSRTNGHQSKKMVPERKPTFTKAISFDNNNETKLVIASQSVDDLNGFLTVRDTCPTNKTALSGPKPVRTEDIPSRSSRNNVGLKSFGKSLFNTNLLIQQMSLAKPEDDVKEEEPKTD